MVSKDVGLTRIEKWLRDNNVAASALGRTACADHSLVSRWRRDGPNAITEAKRCIILQYIEDHPRGIPNYTKGQGGGRRRFSPGAVKTAPMMEPSNTRSTNLPVPGVDHLKRSQDIEWVRQRALKRGVPIVVILCEMVELGIAVTKETDYEEERNGTPSDH